MKATVCALALLLAVVPVAYSQQSASLSSGQNIRAGDVVTFHVQLDRASTQARPAVLVSISPKDGAARAQFGGLQNVALVATGATDCDVVLRIPVTAPAGAWAVDSVRLVLQGGPEVPLRYNTAEFQIQPSEATLPTSATVQVGK